MVREDFEDYQVVEATVKIGEETAIGFGPMGTLDGESDISTVEKKAEGRTLKVKKRVNKMNVTMTGHATVPVKRNIYGLSNEGLKEGVYAYGTDIAIPSIVFTAIILDMEGNKKYMAFPKMEDVKGLNIKIDNDVTEIEMNEFEFTALADSNKKFYYEAYEDELDEETKAAWLTNFTPELVKQ